MTIRAAYEKLASEIVVQAVRDWRKLIQSDAPDHEYIKLRVFFKSHWCGELCGAVDPALLLKKLEFEKRNANIKKTRRRF